LKTPISRFDQELDVKDKGFRFRVEQDLSSLLIHALQSALGIRGFKVQNQAIDPTERARNDPPLKGDGSIVRTAATTAHDIASGEKLTPDASHTFS